MKFYLAKFVSLVSLSIAFLCLIPGFSDNNETKTPPLYMVAVFTGLWSAYKIFGGGWYDKRSSVFNILEIIVAAIFCMIYMTALNVSR